MAIYMAMHCIVMRFMAMRFIVATCGAIMLFVIMTYIASVATILRVGKVGGGIELVIAAVAVGGGLRPGNGIFTISRFIPIRLSFLPSNMLSRLRS